MLTDKVQPSLPRSGGSCNSAKILHGEMEDSQKCQLYRPPGVHTQEINFSL